MPTNDDLIRAIGRMVDQHAVYRAEILRVLHEIQRRIAANEQLLMDTRRMLNESREDRRILHGWVYALFATVAALVLLFVIMTVLSFR